MHVRSFTTNQCAPSACAPISTNSFVSRNNQQGQKRNPKHIVTMGNLSAGKAPTPPERMPRAGHSSGDLLFLLLPAGHRGEFSFPFSFSPSIFSLFPKISYSLRSQRVPAATDPVNKSLRRSSCLNTLRTTTWGQLQAAECQPGGTE